MGLKEILYQGGEVPKGTSPDKVQQLRLHLFEKLFEEMEKKHIWLAACTVAVDAGMWRGERLRKRRLKLLSIINKCSAFLGDEEMIAGVNLPKDWAMKNLYYGYGAHHSYSKDTDISIEESVVLGNFNSLFSKLQRRGEPTDAKRLLDIASYVAEYQMPWEPDEDTPEGETIH